MKAKKPPEGNSCCDGTGRKTAIVCISCGRYGVFLIMEQGTILHDSHDWIAYRHNIDCQGCFYLEIPVAGFSNNEISKHF